MTLFLSNKIAIYFLLPQKEKNNRRYWLPIQLSYDIVLKIIVYYTIKSSR